MSSGRRAGAIILHILAWLVSLGLLALGALLALIGYFDPGPGRPTYWTWMTLSFLVPALGFNPLIWKLVRGALHPLVTIVLSLAITIGLLFVTFNTPHGAYVAADDTPTMRAAAAKGSRDARYALAERLLSDRDIPPAEALAQLRRGAQDGDANAQAFLTYLTMGLKFEERRVMERNDPAACRLLNELETDPRFTGAEVDPYWRGAISDESRWRGWRRANEPGEPLRCERASTTPTEEVFRFVRSEPMVIPDRFQPFRDLKIVANCTVREDGGMKDCEIEEESPAGRGLGAWRLSVMPSTRVERTDIYGWPSADRQIRITTTME